ncbi:MAG: hypothetical protein JRI91_02295 [Deltaproteobacteria bacterium]|nr:hypothetical protein [Deltaproteobacteria bacterium]
MPKQMPTDVADKNLKKVIDICYEMLELADHGDKFRFDDGCGVVYGSLRDSAYKIRAIAKQEMSQHGVSKKKSSQGGKKGKGL